MIKEYTIHQGNMEWLKEKIDKINVRARKLNQPKISLKIIGEKFVKNELTREVTKYVDIEIDSEIIQVNGYEFIGTINHTYGTGNVVKSITGEELPKKYRTIDGYCEHCHTNRRRKETVLLRKDGEIIQVGKSCLKDFLGYDINSQLYYINLLHEFDKETEEHFHFEGDKFEKFLSLEDLLKAVNFYIKRTGYISRTKAREQMESEDIIVTATVDRAYELLFANVKYLDADEEKFIVDLENEDVEVKNALNWVRNEVDGYNEFMSNLKTVCANDFIGYREIGIAGSLLPTYYNFLHKEDEKKKELEAKKASEYVGTIGKREDFELYVDEVIGYETQWGYSYVNIMHDDNNNIIVWKGSHSLNEGNTVLLKGTVKEHSEYNSAKQTYLSRCKVLSTEVN